MKKALSLILALVIAMTSLTNIAMAETAEETSKGFSLSSVFNKLGSLFHKEESKEEGTEGSSILSELMNILGKLFSKEGREALRNAGKEGPLKAFLLDLLESLIDQITQMDFRELLSVESVEQFFLTLLDDFKQIDLENAVKAESIDQFYGSWNLSKVYVFGEEIPVTAIFHIVKLPILNISEKGITGIETEMKLSDGILVFGGQDIVYIYLCDSGVCLSASGLLSLKFTPKK